MTKPLPVVGAERDTWGEKLNDYLTELSAAKADVAALAGKLDATVASATYASIGVRATGAVKGDGVTDDTSAINDIIAANAGKTIDFPDGTYMVNAVASIGASYQPVGIKLNQPDTRLLLGAGAVLKVIPNAEMSYSCVQVTAADCVIEGGTIIGDVGTHTGSTGEWGHGIDINVGADRCHVRGTRVTKCWGDGILVMGRPLDISIEFVHAEDNRRQGLSIIDAIRPKVVGGAYINTGLTAFTGPGAGIDIEPDAGSGRDVIDFLIEGVLLSGNLGDGFLSSSNGRTVSGTINARSIGNGGNGAEILGATNATIVHGEYLNNAIDGVLVGADVLDSVLSGVATRGNRFGVMNTGTRTVIKDVSAQGNLQSGLAVNGPDCVVTGFVAVGNCTSGTVDNVQVDINGTNAHLNSVESHAGIAATKPAFGIVVRGTATGARLHSCDATGAFSDGAYLDQTGTAVAIPVPGVAKQTGVAVTAAGIHAALVALGIITA